MCANHLLGCRIVSNALAAYWAFQAWGNDPDNFDKDLILSFTQHWNDDKDNSDIGEQYDLHTWKSRGWGFSAIELFQQLCFWLAGLFKSWKPIQNLEKLCDRNGIITDWFVNNLDAESWSSNKDGFAHLLDTMCQHMEIQQYVCLSGDVHYSFTAKAGFKHQSGIKSYRNWALLPGQRWIVEVELLKAEKTDLRVTPECNLGLVAFSNGLPISHTLLIGKNNQLIFHLPK